MQTVLFLLVSLWRGSCYVRLTALGGEQIQYPSTWVAKLHLMWHRSSNFSEIGMLVPASWIDLPICPEKPRENRWFSFLFELPGNPGALGTASRSTLLASLSCWRFGCWIASWPQINSILVHPCSSGCRPCSADNWMTLMASRHMKKLNTNLFFHVRKLRKYTPARKSCNIDSATIHDSRCAREQIWKEFC